MAAPGLGPARVSGRGPGEGAGVLDSQAALGSLLPLCSGVILVSGQCSGVILVSGSLPPLSSGSFLLLCSGVAPGSAQGVFTPGITRASFLALSSGLTPASVLRGLSWLCAGRSLVLCSGIAPDSLGSPVVPGMVPVSLCKTGASLLYSFWPCPSGSLKYWCSGVVWSKARAQTLWRVIK